MNCFTRKAISVLALASAGLLASASSQAGLISYDFSVRIDTETSPLFDEVFNGSFSYDDTDVPSPGFNGEDLYALHGFLFNFAGNVYGLSDLFYGDAAVRGSTLLGLDAGALEFSFLPANDSFPAYFAYDLGNGNAGNGSVSFTEVQEAPEPASALLFGTALLALGRMHSRRDV